MNNSLDPHTEAIPRCRINDLERDLQWALHVYQMVIDKHREGKIMTEEDCRMHERIIDGYLQGNRLKSVTIPPVGTGNV